MRDPQEYDYTDLINELVSDASTYEGFRDWYYSGGAIDWERAYKSFAWEGSVFRQFVEWVCDGREGLVSDVFYNVIDNGEYDKPLHMIVEADNYGHMKEAATADRVMELIELWTEEGVI